MPDDSQAERRSTSVRQGLGAVLGRVAAVIGGLLLAGIILRLIVAVLAPVLPPGFMGALTAGWNMLFGIVSPAMGAIMAVVILAAICWVIVGRR
jgi:hypothetical protein